MWENISAPISKTTARDILIPLLPVNANPDLETAAQIADELMRDHGMFCTVDFILDVLTRRKKDDN